jgi:hypothetical protein
MILSYIDGNSTIRNVIWMTKKYTHLVLYIAICISNYQMYYFSFLAKLVWWVGYGQDARVVIVLFPAGTREFSPKRPDRVMGPPNLLFNVNWGIPSRGIKRPVREAGNVLESSAKIKNARNYSSISVHAVHSDKFTLQKKCGNTVRTNLTLTGPCIINVFF